MIFWGVKIDREMVLLLSLFCFFSVLLLWFGLWLIISEEKERSEEDREELVWWNVNPAS